MTAKLLRIEAPHFCASIKVGIGWCAPIINYMRGWSEERIRSYCRKKGWKVVECNLKN